MNKRSNALKEALQKNEEDVEKWKCYVKENKIAVENLDMFSKHLTVEVMIPIGSKAFFPGRLKHTNEVLVSHSRDYFSRCSAHTAMTICRKRIEHGKQYLKMLEAERDMFHNKLKIPHQSGVFPNIGEHEIFEKYDEEKEKQWKEEHSKRLNTAKLQEKQKRQEMFAEQNYINKSQLIEEDLENELSTIEVELFRETEEMTKKLMCGKMCEPLLKKRIAQNAHSSVPDLDRLELNQIKIIKNKEEKAIVEDIDLRDNKSIENSSENIIEESESDVSDFSDFSDVPEEIRIIEKQGQYLPPSDRIGFYNYQLQIIDQMIGKESLNTFNELEEKLKLYKIRYDLEELIEMLDEACSSDVDVATNELLTQQNDQSVKSFKKTISFSRDNKMLEFRKNECVTLMLTPKFETNELLECNTTNDSTQLNGLIDLGDKAHKEPNNTTKKSNNEECRKDLFVSTNNVKNPDENSPNVLCINFKHSRQEEVKNRYLMLSFPNSPKDIYEIFYLEIINDISTNRVHCSKACVDGPFESISAKSHKPALKSILKNKTQTQFEGNTSNHEILKNQVESGQMSKLDCEVSGSYNKVMGDVVENFQIKPSPLPDDTIINAHTPIKKNSLFKNKRKEINS